jgi:DNA polymerase III subunit gamma/tau
MADAPFVSLYRRFRPGRFGELRGQDHVVRVLQSAVRDGRVSHAYLFSGPRGTGKTSSARILAKALNCLKPEDGEPCGLCTSCVEIERGTSLDVHELDAASNNGVDAMRDLVSHAALGTPGRWKVYIVDEVHMLSNSAANALLKTLEEPPSHVVFVLATTEQQKVPATIRSRTQHLEFRLINADTLQELLESVRSEVGLEIDDASIQGAVRRGHGSARDALSALDLVVASGTGEPARPQLETVVAAVAAADAGGVLLNVSALTADGWGPQQLATELVDDFRQAFLAALAPELCAVSGTQRAAFAAVAESMGLARVVRSMEILGEALIDMRDAPDPQVVLEIAVVRAARSDLDHATAALAERVEALERSLAHGSVASPRSSTTAPSQPSSPPAPVPDVAKAPPAPAEASQTAVAAPAEVGRQQSIGAILRGRAEPTATPPERNVESPPPEVSAALPAESDRLPATPRQEPRTGVDRDSLTQAWGDGVLHGLSARAKALYSAGRFVGIDEGGGALFALPNVAHRDRCLDRVAEVESALAAHFGVPIRLVLIVDGSDGPPVTNAAAPTPGGGGGFREAEEILEEEDPAVFDTAQGEDDQQASAVDRLLRAFPGASEIAE